MAILSASQCDELRQGITASTEKAGVAVNYSKAQMNAAIQAIEDYFENTAKAGFGSSIEAAAAGVFNNAAKKRIIAHWLRQKFVREGV